MGAGMQTRVFGHPAEVLERVRPGVAIVRFLDDPDNTYRVRYVRVDLAVIERIPA